MDERQRDARPAHLVDREGDLVAVELGRDRRRQAPALVDGGPVRPVEDHLDRCLVALQQLVHRGLVDLAGQVDGTGHDAGHHAALEVDVLGPDGQSVDATTVPAHVVHDDVDLLEALEVEAGSPRAQSHRGRRVGADDRGDVDGDGPFG